MKLDKASIAAAASDRQEAIDAISTADERALGESASIALISVRGGLVLDETLIAYVNDVGNLVARQGSRTALRKDGTPRMLARRIFVGVIDDANAGSWSFPGGFVFVSRGLLELLQSESELAWVLGREIAHIDNEDGLRVLKMQVGSRAFMVGASKPGIDLKDKEVFNRAVDKLAEIQLRVGLGRDDERNADSQGLMYSTKAGYDAAGAKRVLAVLGSLDAAKPKMKLFTSIDTPEQRFRTIAKILETTPGGTSGDERYDTLCLKRLEAYALTQASAP